MVRFCSRIIVGRQFRTLGVDTWPKFLALTEILVHSLAVLYRNGSRDMQLDPNENARLKCADRMDQELQKLINQGCGVDALLWGVNMAFAELVRHGDGGDDAVVDGMIMFSKLNRTQRDQAQTCQQYVNKVNAALSKEGFGHDAIMWSLIGVISEMSRGLGMSQDEIKTVRDDMATLLSRTHWPTSWPES